MERPTENGGVAGVLAGDGVRLEELSIIIPAYRQPLMLTKQLETWAEYDDKTLGRLRFIIIDDGSPEPLGPVVGDAESRVFERTSLYRTLVDMPWTRGFARNLGAHVCETAWLAHFDVDHVLPPDAAAALFQADVDARHWYRFRRFRVGKADDTRKKDLKNAGLPDDAEFGEVTPHIDGYVVTRDLYWRSGGYDEDYLGMLGGGSAFLAELTKVGGKPLRLPDDVFLHVYTTHVVSDASVRSLDRDTSRYSELRKRKEREGRTKAVNPLRLPWERVL